MIDMLCEPVNLILDSVGIYVRYHENSAQTVQQYKYQSSVVDIPQLNLTLASGSLHQLKGLSPLSDLSALTIAISGSVVIIVLMSVSIATGTQTRLVQYKQLVMYSRIPYLNNSLSSWAIYRSDLRRLLYYTGVCSGMPLSVPLQRRDINKTLSSTLKVVLRQVRVPIPQSKILQREYRKRKLAVPFSFWSVFILTKCCDYVTI